MSEQVDKATFRALTAEKRLQEAGFEEEIRKLQVFDYFDGFQDLK